MPSKSKHTKLLDQLITSLEAYKAFLSKDGTSEEAELDQALRDTNMNMSIYDPLVVLDDLIKVKSSV